MSEAKVSCLGEEEGVICTLREALITSRTELSRLTEALAAAEHIQRVAESPAACWKRALEEERRCRWDVEARLSAEREKSIQAYDDTGTLWSDRYDAEHVRFVLLEGVVAAQTKRAEEAEAKLAEWLATTPQQRPPGQSCPGGARR